MFNDIFLFIKEYHSSLIRGAITFTDNALVFFFNKKLKRGPLFVNLNITYRCNATCSFCNTHELNKANVKTMTTEDVLRIVREIGEFGTWHLSITGGETLLRKDLDVIILEAKKYNMFVNINTNGLLLAGKSKMLADTGVDSITISLDSDQAKTHDEIRGIPGLTQAIVNGIETINSLRNGKKPIITLRVVVSKQNYESLDNIIDVFSQKVDKIFFQPLHDGVNVPKFAKKNAHANYSLFKVRDTNKYMFQNKDRSHFAEVFNALIKKHKWLDTLYYRESEIFIFDKDTLWNKYKCYAGYFYMSIDPSGRVSSCPFLDGSLGNVVKHSVMDVWGGEEMKNWRKVIKNKKNECMCWCGISEVNAFLKNKFENRFVQSLMNIMKIIRH